jgi:hypothetical protein
MKRILWFVLAIGCAGAALADGVNVYGQIDIGGYPNPPVVYPQAVVVAPAPEYAAAPPVYLHVRPGEEKHWREHCGAYHACGRRVYFVKDDWYNGEYAHHHHEHEHEHEHDRDHD